MKSRSISTAGLTFSGTACKEKTPGEEGYWNHCFLECEGRRIDPTYRQFAPSCEYYHFATGYTPLQFILGVLVVPRKKVKWALELVEKCYTRLEVKR